MLKRLFCRHDYRPRTDNAWPHADYWRECRKCGKKRGFAFIVGSAEAPRLRGLNHMPAERRQAAVDEIIRRAK